MTPPATNPPAPAHSAARKGDDVSEEGRDEAIDDGGLDEIASFRRPRLRPEVPVMWRSASSVQIGGEVVLTDVTRAHVAWMTSLDGLSGPAAIEESLTLPLSQARRLLRALLAAAAIEDAGRVPISVRWAAPSEREVERRRFAVALSTYRTIERAHDAMVHRDRSRVCVRGRGPVADEVRSALDAGGLAEHAADSGRHPDLIILTDAPHPDVPAQVEIPALVLPHLHVGVHGDRATVGPLVVPGVTSCLRCRHLHRRDADPAWPLLSVQWAQAVGDEPVAAVDPLLARIAADWAVLISRSFIDLPDDPQSWGNMAIEMALPLGAVQVRERPAHPLCGCMWNGG